MRSVIFKSPLPYLALILAHLIWGSNFVVAKVTLQEFPTMSLSFLRFAFAVMLLAPFFIYQSKKETKIESKDIPKLFLMGVLMITFSIALFYEGLNRTTAIDASVLTMTVPIISLLASWIFLKEKIFWVNLLGIGFGLIGAILIIGLPILLVGSFDTSNLFGNFLIILSSITFVAGTFFSKDLMKKYPILTLTGVMFLVGVVTFLLPAISEYFQNPTWPTNISIYGILGLLFITFLSTISAFFLLEWGLKKTSIYYANLFQYLEPAVAATLASLVLGERISFSFIIGACLIVLGVYFGTFNKPHHFLQHKHHRN